MHNSSPNVFISLGKEDVRVGKLWFHTSGARESASFEYDKKWLEHPERFALEPALQLTEGSFHTKSGMGLLGSIGDSSPDRWGRVLMRRAEALKSGAQKKTARTLLEVDYLLGVCDEARQGALRFSINPNDDVFLSPNHNTSIPPLIDLPKLLSATERFTQDSETVEDIKLLLAPGSSLGGARPKASIRDADGTLAIAKFSRKDDEFSAVLWEAVALTLAKRGGIKVPPYRVEKVLNKPVLIVTRFDRNKKERIPFLSALSMLEAVDNEPHSYLEIVYALARHGACPEEDMKELWRRIVLTIMISNTDDHLRNHGFTYSRCQGWRLSPAYDINPTSRDTAPKILSTSIDFHDHSASLDIALSVIDEFRISKSEATTIIKEVSSAVKTWREVASGLGLSKKECDRMSSAFVY